MDYFCFTQSVVSYIENRVKSDFDYAGLVNVTGFSLPHTREVFRNHTRMSLAKYILNRKIANAAFELIHTNKSTLDIALDYGFETYDTFTRAFKRTAGVTPREFRKNGGQVGRIMLTGGVFGPGIISAGASSPVSQLDLETVNMNKISKTGDSCILFGVSKVQYAHGECTPFPASLKACLNYLGQEISYAYLMAASGAAFRLRWNTKYWDGGNVGISFIYENPAEAYRRSFQAAGRSFNILDRRPETTKDDFIHFIKPEIDAGRPVIGIGIIGPPEACIITGYRDNGRTLLGWNFFQHNTEYAKDSTIDESGYFICKSWWENEYTIALMSVGEEKNEGTGTKEILLNAVAIMSRELIGNYTGGQTAYDAWAKAMSDESQFPKDAVLPMLFERLMCQVDAMTMIGEGRYYASCFMEMVALQNSATKKDCLQAARYFNEEASVSNDLMSRQLGGLQMSEETAKKLAEPPVRKEIVKLIMRAKELDVSAAGCLQRVLEKM